MKQISRVLDNKSYNIMQWLSEQLHKSSEQLGDPDSESKIHEMIEHRQDKIFHFFNNDLNSYFTITWQHLIAENPDFQQVITTKMDQRQNIIYQELIQQKIKIAERQPLLPFDYQQENKLNKINVLRLQSDNLKKKINQINTNLEADNSQSQLKEMKDIYSKLYSEQKIKQTEQFIKKNKQAQLQRRKKLQQQRKKQQQALLKKQSQIKQHEEEILRQRRQEILKKQKQLHEKRQKQKQIREQRNTQYMRIRKSIDQKPPLFLKMYEGYSKRYAQQEKQKLKIMEVQRKHLIQNINSQILLKHEKQYQQLKQKRQKQRKQRHQSAQQQKKSRAKFHSSFQIQKYVDPKQIQRQQAKQRLQKVKQYKSVVKQKFVPKIDEDKRKQLMNLIEQMQLNHKRVKRVRLQNGSVMYQQLKSADPKMIGLQYLQQAKQIASKARQRKKQQKDVVQVDQTKQIKKPINYLQQLRKNRPKQDKTTFVQKKNMSFDDKVKKVMQQSEKLAEITKQNQMMLKFGKFKTSEEILACKQQIDKNYLQIVNMKLKLILSQQNKNKDKQQSQFSEI